jgi:phosphate starvation-inducible protein PhoH
MIIVGDSAQVDLRDKKQSGFTFLCNNFKEIEGFSVITLKTNHRDSIVEPILKIYADHRG